MATFEALFRKTPCIPSTFLFFSLTLSTALLSGCAARAFNNENSSVDSVTTEAEGFAYGVEGRDPNYDGYERKAKAQPPKGF